MTLIWTSYNNFDLPEDVLKSWEELLSGQNLPNVQNSHWWLTIWWKHFGVGNPDIRVLREADKIVAILPLMKIEERVKFSPVKKVTLSFAGHGFSDSLALLTDKDNENVGAEIIKLLSSFEGQFDEIRLSPLNSGEHTSFLNRESGMENWQSVRIEGNPVLDLTGSWEDCLQATGKNLRKDLRKKNRRLHEAGFIPELILEREFSTELLEPLRKLAEKRFAADEHKSSFLNAKRYDFIIEACTESSRRGHFACYTYRHEDRILAFRFGFIFHETYLDWITNYDPEFFPYSIGKLMLADLIQNLYSINVKRLNFMAGEEEYKLKWMPVVHDMSLLRCYKASIANKLQSAISSASKIKRSIKSNG
jgi:CelD/BcsL family acetyltransferase involved in cellulose biosynthesis